MHFQIFSLKHRFYKGYNIDITDTLGKGVLILASKTRKVLVEIVIANLALMLGTILKEKSDKGIPGHRENKSKSLRR